MLSVASMSWLKNVAYPSFITTLIKSDRLPMIDIRGLVDISELLFSSYISGK